MNKLDIKIIKLSFLYLMAHLIKSIFDEFKQHFDIWPVDDIATPTQTESAKLYISTPINKSFTKLYISEYFSTKHNTEHHHWYCANVDGPIKTIQPVQLTQLIEKMLIIFSNDQLNKNNTKNTDFLIVQYDDFLSDIQIKIVNANNINEIVRTNERAKNGISQHMFKKLIYFSDYINFPLEIFDSFDFESPWMIVYEFEKI